MLRVRLIRAAHHALIFVFVVATTLVLSAQTVVDPQYVEFNASVDHNTSRVSRYSLSIYPAGDSAPFATVDLGKPTPNASGVIRVDFLPLLPVPPQTGVTYEARVAAVGPGGLATSSVSNAFSFSAPCAPTISPASRAIASSSATGSVAVTAGTGCAWSAVSNAAWISITGGATGSGNGTVNYSVSANLSSSGRVGTLTIAGWTFTVTQSGVTCTTSLSPASASIQASGGSGSTAVSAPAGCSWTAVSSATSWLTVTAGSSGSGAGTVSFSAAANTRALPRQATLTIGGQTFVVDQAPAPCTYSLSPPGATVAAAGTTGSTSVSSPDGCSWTAVSNAPLWLTVTNGASGDGNDAFTYAVDANPSSQARQGTISVGGQTFTVNQSGAPCTYSLAPASVSAGPNAFAGTTAVTAPAGCTWSAVTGTPAWLSVTGGATGSGNGTVSFSAAANTAGTARIGTITIGGQTFTVNQGAAGCTFSLAPTSASVATAGGTGSTAVTAPAGCAWSASSGASWLTITAGASGSGNGTVFFSAAANPQTQTRQGVITLGGQTFTVTQAAAACSFTIAPTTMAAATGGGTGSTTVQTTAGCSWTAQSNASWITITAGGSGNGTGTVTFSVAATTGSSARTGTLTVAGRTFTVTQAGAGGCQYTLGSSSQTVLPGGGPATVALTTTTGCFWTATSGVSWITLSTWGSGSRTISFTVAPNTSGSTRTGQLTVAGRSHTVIQPSGTVPAAPRSLRVVIAVNGGS